MLEMVDPTIITINDKCSSRNNLGASRQDLNTLLSCYVALTLAVNRGLGWKPIL